MAVLGDFFLDSYLIMERRLSELSIETGLEAFQVVETRQYPGAAGTVVSNLRALGAQVMAIGLYGDDGNGYLLQRKLLEQTVDLRGFTRVAGMLTPTYTKPIMRELDGYEHELNRMDIKRRTVMPASLEETVRDHLQALLPEADGMLVIDQVTERNCGVITDRIRAEVGQTALLHPEKIICADSREHLGLFENVILKSNVRESLRAARLEPREGEALAVSADRCGRELSTRTRHPVVITLGSEGLYLVENEQAEGCFLPSLPVNGPIDIVGAGDSVNASVGAALCAGASLKEAGILGNLAASVVIQQVGTTGTASPSQILEQFDAHPEMEYFE
jgi:rfaE bifunctional protein kinase chain/domain